MTTNPEGLYRNDSPNAVRRVLRGSLRILFWLAVIAVAIFVITHLGAAAACDPSGC
jgi:hypothetical protein